ncbi:hypothetical protein FH609_011725 [Streptomyces sp. 3MP-14]|uniref:Uncharacterized protein n=1 Tax=Streptomyces mimosae TaxID=2586635 RepID=A0A5N6AE19_9ACTN|nr:MULTISPECIES: hypothetical protein [Streptomyces]KAB8167064.1 hypothetical protein FH607_009175 [Streptomyces mimosae]KAB8177005.1 hypothetical protein FH609_011725 [Streptomyces sp. 3MP-14]
MPELRYEINTGGQWEDITADVRTREATRITRGRPDGANTADPGSCSFQLNNGISRVTGAVGRYSPRNPRSDLYGRIGRNTPVRVSVRAGAPYLRVPAAPVGRLSTPSSAALDTTGDLDVRVEWAPDQIGTITQEVAARYHTGRTRIWRLLLELDGRLYVAWSPDGSFYPELNVPSTAPITSGPGQRIALRFTLDIDNGNGGHTLTYYTAPTMAGPWSVLGAPHIGAGTTSVITGGDADLELGNATDLGFQQAAGRYYAFQLRDGIDGPPLTDVDLTAQTPGATAFTDAAGVPWTVVGGAEVTDWYPRWVGEIPAWPPRWSPGDTDIWVPVTAAGILRRLGQGARPLQSTLRRRIPSTDVLAYWPLEDGAEATEAASALAGGQPATIANLDMAAASDLPSSAPLPVLQQGATFLAPLPSLPNPALGWRAEMAYRLDTLPSSSAGWFRVDTTGGGIATITGYIGGGEARIIARDEDGAVVAQGWWNDSTALAAAYGRWCRVRLVAVPITGGWDYRLWWTPIGTSENWYTSTSSNVGPLPFTRPRRINCQWPTALVGMPVGHITYINNPSLDVYGAGSGGPDDGHRWETAPIRMRRLATEEQLPIATPGLNGSGYTWLGPQRIATVLDLVRQAAEADGGELTELRDQIGLGYRPRLAQYNRPPDLALDYAAGHIAPPIEPQDDDQDVTNDITVTRTSGSSARAVLESGPLSIQAPPAGIGVYDSSVDLNVASDGQLDQIAAWRLHLGTPDEMRYPVIRLNLRNQRMAEHIQRYLDRVDVGARITIANPPSWLPAVDIDLIAQSYTEILNADTWDVELACAPASVWRTAEVGETNPADDDAPACIDTDGSTLAADAAPDDDRLIVQTLDGPVWVTSAGPAPTAVAGDLPVDLAVGGEVVTATAVEPFVWDDFARTEASGWGDLPCTTPVSWVLTGGAPADRTVAGGRGIVALPAPNAPRFQYVSTWSHADAEVLVSITPSAVATGAPLLVGSMLRISGAEWYWPRLILGLGGSVSLEIARGLTPISALVPTGRTYAGGTTWWLRGRTVGSTIQAKAWPATVREPMGWQVTATDTVITSGFVGVVAMTSTGNSNSGLTIAFDGFEMVSPQLMTVERSVNSVSKSHASGTDIRLHRPMIVAL